MQCSQQPLLYLLNHLYSFTCLHHIQTFIMDGGFFALKVLSEGNEAVVPSPQVIALCHQYALAEQRLGSNRKFLPEVDVPQRQWCHELQEQKEHTRCARMCLSPLGTLQGTDVIPLEKPCSLPACLARSKQGGRRQLQKPKPQNWEGFFHVPC